MNETECEGQSLSVVLLFLAIISDKGEKIDQYSLSCSVLYIQSTLLYLLHPNVLTIKSAFQSLKQLDTEH